MSSLYSKVEEGGENAGAGGSYGSSHTRRLWARAYQEYAVQRSAGHVSERSGGAQANGDGRDSTCTRVTLKGQRFGKRQNNPKKGEINNKIHFLYFVLKEHWLTVMAHQAMLHHRPPLTLHVPLLPPFMLTRNCASRLFSLFVLYFHFYFPSPSPSPSLFSSLCVSRFKWIGRCTIWRWRTMWTTT